MTNFEALVSLNMVPEIGTIRLKKLLESFGKPENILKAPAQNLEKIYGIGEKIAAKICALKKEDLARELAQAKKQNIKIITQDDATYPENLKSISDPPIVLYLKGALKPEDKYSLAIVGSRRASYYGLSNAENFAAGLSAKGLVIVSGMARGIDTAAHQGALKQAGRTIAVIGSGFNCLYPEENKELAERIAHNGAVISEFPMNTLPFPQNFPQRNRVVSGLSLGVLVVEAAQNSGALITADFALEQGREVFALPGKVDSGNSFGTNQLIKEGAKLVSCLEDILEELPLPQAKKQKKTEAVNLKNESAPKQDEETALFDLISEEPIEIDELVERSSLSVANLSELLLRLQLKKMIKQLPGKQFMRVSNER